MNKILKQFYIEPDQCKWLEKESRRTGQSQAEIIRNLIKKFKNEDKVR
jgi:hypothetical protein